MNEQLPGKPKGEMKFSHLPTAEEMLATTALWEKTSEGVSENLELMATLAAEKATETADQAGLERDSATALEQMASEPGNENIAIEAGYAKTIAGVREGYDANAQEYSRRRQAAIELNKAKIAKELGG
ncbi:MAG: hypothetical protein WC802_00080 [Patescibacteria group bacterium]|jgi:hypothetical protein